MPALSIGEATSVLSAAVVIVTFFIGRVSVSKTSSAKEQRTEDKLDSLCGDTSEIKDGVKEINRKLDDHGERLRVQWQLDPAADGACLPPLLLQPLVENAVKHGVEPSPQGGKLRISTQRRGERAIVRITNTLAPESAVGPVRGHGIALNNVRERLALLHDVQAHMSVRQKNGLYQVRIALPCSP